MCECSHRPCPPPASFTGCVKSHPRSWSREPTSPPRFRRSVERTHSHAHVALSPPFSGAMETRTRDWWSSRQPPRSLVCAAHSTGLDLRLPSLLFRQYVQFRARRWFRWCNGVTWLFRPRSSSLIVDRLVNRVVKSIRDRNRETRSIYTSTNESRFACSSRTRVTESGRKSMVDGRDIVKS